MESSKTIGGEAFRTTLLQGHNQFYGVITFSQRYQQTVYLGKIFWTQFDCITNKKPNSLGIKIYGKYQWIKKFDKHLYPMLYTSYAIKKIYNNFAWLFLLIELVKMSQKREKLKLKTLTFEHKSNCVQKIKKEHQKSLFVSFKCSPRQSHFKRFTARSMTRSIVKLFSFLVFVFKYLFCFNLLQSLE